MKTRFSAVLLCLSLALAATPALSSEPGHVDLTPLAGAMNTTPTVNLAFGPAMMAGFAETLRQNNPELADVLKSVKGLRVMVYEDVDSSGTEPRANELLDQMDAAGWSPALTIRDGSTEIDLLLLESEQYVKGLTLLLRDGSSTAVFANIHGDLDPVIIGQLIGSGKAMEGFDLGELMSQLPGQDDNGED